MSANGRQSSKHLFGSLGLLVIAAVFIVAVSLSNAVLRGLRLDLTENGLYTLSEGTRNILGDIEEPLNLYFFYSDRATAEMPYIRTYAGRVREILDEFVEHAGGKLRVSVIDPLPFSEDEDRAAEFGLQAINVGGSIEPVYMGIAGTNSVDDEEIIAFLDPAKESFLEYDLARLIDTLANPQRPVIGLLTDLQLSGGFDPQLQRPLDPWVIDTQIEQLFDVRRLQKNLTRIDEDITVLLVAHAKELGDEALYAIDQFIMRGGRALLVVDPYAEIDIPVPDPTNPAAAMMASRSSDLNRLTGAWGITTSTEQYVADDRYALAVSGIGGRPLRHIGLLGIDAAGIDGADVVTSNLSNLNFGYPGAISVAADAAADMMALIESSELSALMPTGGLAFMRDPEALRDGFEPSGDRHVIAARISGEVPSAFADGPPDGIDNPDHFAAAAEPINVLLIADADFLADRLWAQVQSFFGQRIATAFAGNGDLVANALDNLTGSGDLISIRGRATFTRPFTRVDELRRDAESRFRETEQRLQQELRDTESKLADLQANREDSSALILTGEQEAELERFRQERLRIRKDLRQVQRDLDQQIEDLGTRLKVINIGAVPVVITLISIVMLILRRQRPAAA
jgi:ABC-type uncharacterized transport system involved in gliding motility auxiliary subunit